MPRPTTSPLLVTAFAVSLLACMCGGPADPGPVEATPTWAPAEAAPEAPAVEAPAAGGWSASIRGVCEMERDCNCLEKATVDACEESLNKSAAAFDAGVLTCIVTQSCASMCGGGGVRCIEEGYQRMSAASAAQHQMNMAIINNYPGGGPCPSGMTQEVDASGRFLRCR